MKTKKHPVKNWLNWNELVCYDENNLPSCLRTKVEIRGGRPPGRLIKSPGDSIGWIDNLKNRSPQVNISINSVSYLASRVVWELFNGPIPDGMIIDHLYGNTLDNRIENLECKTSSGNGQNQKKNKNNKSGYPGVRFVDRGQGNPFWYAYLSANKILYDKSFPIKIHGEDALPRAIQWRKDKIMELNNKGLANFTNRHIEGENIE